MAGDFQSADTAVQPAALSAPPSGASPARPPVSRWHQRRVPLSLAIAFLASLTAIGGWALGGLYISRPAESAGLKVDPKHLDFGQAWVTRSFPLAFPIENTADEPIEIHGFISSCGCADIEPEHLILQPGERTVLHAAFDFTNRRTQAPSQHFELKITPIVNGLQSEIPWVFHGTVRAPIYVSESRVLFNDAIARQSANYEIDVGAYTPLSRLSATLDHPQIGTILVTPLEVDEEGFPVKYRLLISTNPSLPVGPFATQLRISVETANGDVLSNVYALPISGDVAPRITAFPQHVFAGRILSDDVFVQILLINCSQDPELKITTVTADVPTIGVQRAPEHDVGSWVAHEVSISSTSAGRHQHAVLVSAVDSHGDSESLRVPVTFFGE